MATIDVDAEKKKQLENVQKIIDKLMTLIDSPPDDEGNFDWGAIMKGIHNVLPYFERHAELLGLNAAPQTQKVELSGDIGHLLKLVQTEAEDERSRAGSKKSG